MTTTHEPTYEEQLAWLLELIQGTRWPFSQGLTSYDNPAPEHQDLHQACLELERRGQIYRQHVLAGSLGWMPVESSAAVVEP